MMKQVSAIFISASLVFPIFAQANSGITVTGKASVEKAPDQFTVVFTFENRHKVVNKAKANVDQKVDLLLKSVKRLNIKDDAITSTHLQITPIYPKTDNNHRIYTSHDSKHGTAVISSELREIQASMTGVLFEVRRKIEVNLSDIAGYEKLLDSAVKIGVSRISPVQSSIANSDKYYQQALAAAVENARQKATRLAENLNVTLGKVTVVNEHAYRAPGRMVMASEAMMADSAMKTYTGVNQITAEVTVTFSLQ